MEVKTATQIRTELEQYAGKRALAHQLAIEAVESARSEWQQRIRDSGQNYLVYCRLRYTASDSLDWRVHTLIRDDKQNYIDHEEDITGFPSEYLRTLVELLI